MSRHRRRKTPLWQTVPLWAAAAALAGWGLWQAAELRRSVLAGVRPAAADAATTRPSLAVASETVAPDPDVAGTVDFVDPLLEPVVPAESRRQQLAGFADLPAYDPAFSAPDLAAQGDALMAEGRIVDGRNALNAALARCTDEALAARLRGGLSAMNGSVFLGTALLPDDPLARYVDIQPGDSFLKLGRTFGVPAAYLAAINPDLNPRNLKPTAGVKIVQGPFAVRVVKRAARLDLFARDMYVRSYAIALPEGNYLPRGAYRVAQGTKVQAGGRAWIGFEGAEDATAGVQSGWMYGSTGPRGSAAKDRATGVRLADGDLLQLFAVLVETRSTLQVEP